MLRKMLIIAAFSAIAIQTAAAQAKTAIVRLQDALLATADMKKAQAEIQGRFKPRQDALEKLQRELQDIQNKLNSPTLAPAAAADLQNQGQRKQRESQRLQQDLEEEFNRERQDILTRAGGRMNEVLKKLAEEKGYDTVVDAGSTLYFKPALDVTNEVVSAYDKAYPAK